VLWCAIGTLWRSVLCRGVTARCGRQPKSEHAHLGLISSAASQQADGIILGQLWPFCRWDQFGDACGVVLPETAIASSTLAPVPACAERTSAKSGKGPGERGAQEQCAPKRRRERGPDGKQEPNGRHWEGKGC